MNTDTILVVGVDGSDGGRRALRWAVEEAARTPGTVVKAVTTWQWDGIQGGLMAARTPDDAQRDASRILTEAVASVRDEFGGETPPIVRETVRGPSGAALARVAETAHLLVLGSHGHSRLRHAVLGSVTEECVRRATCPVVVVPVPHHAKREAMSA